MRFRHGVRPVGWIDSKVLVLVVDYKICPLKEGSTKNSLVSLRAADREVFFRLVIDRIRSLEIKSLVWKVDAAYATGVIHGVYQSEGKCGVQSDDFSVNTVAHLPKIILRVIFKFEVIYESAQNRLWQPQIGKCGVD